MLFDTSVQELKYKVLKEIARLAFDGELERGILGIAEKIVPGPDPTMRCCIYKEREIVNQRVKIAMGRTGDGTRVIEVLDIACDECPLNGIQVTESCRGCIAHRCMNACPRDAIKIVDHKAQIDKTKCIECGKCMTVCPYSAIAKRVRPCVNACKVNAITINEQQKVDIHHDKCISCGACVYQCPFGAVVDKSFILETIDILKGSENNTKYKVYALVAPSISSQFEAPLGKVVSGIKQLGFHSVIEVALGADMVAYQEAKELAEKKFLTSSCCPAFVRYIETQFPKVLEHVSHNLSPMAELAKHIRENDENCKIVFIGPCIAKKVERERENVRDLVDNVITFEELQALLHSRDIDLDKLDEEILDNASYYGRIFARSGGLSDAVAQALKELGITEEQFKLNAIACEGINNCKTALIRANVGKLEQNFIEGMACNDGCIGGPACLTHGPKERQSVDKFGMEAKEKTIKDAISVFNIE